MTKYAEIKKNDIVDCREGICVSFWTQGCHFHCIGCHNPEQQNFNGGIEFTNQTMADIISAIDANGIKRNFSILGGEPLCDENIFLTELVLLEVRKHFPNIEICLWTGYTFEELLTKDDRYKTVLQNVDFLIDGKFILSQRDITLNLRGSSNQRIINVPESIKNNCIITVE